MKKEPLIKKLQDLQKEKNILFERLKTVSENTLETPSEEGKWSLLQILYHIQISENGTLSYIQKKYLYADKSPIPKKNIFSSLRGMLLQYYFMSNIKGKAPKGLDTFPEKIYFDKVVKDSQIQSQKWIDFIQSSDENILHTQIFKHPLVGRIDLMDTIQFTVLHFQKHKKQIVNILQNGNATSNI